MDESISANKNALIEALDLSREIIKNIELDEISLSNIALRTCRLSRLLNDFEMQRVFQLEVSGYDSFPNGLPPDLWRIAGIAKRHYQKKDSNENKINAYMFRESIAEIEDSIEVVKHSLEAAKDPNVTITSANPNQWVQAPLGNVLERNNLRQYLSTNLKKLASRKALIYDYVIRKHYELKFSGIADDIFSRIRENVDDRIGQYLPESIKKLTAVYDNLRSENPEDWSNAVHSCRRILQDLADAVYPAKDEPIQKEIEGKIQKIKVGKDNYINRIIAFAEEQSNSERFNEIVGSFGLSWE